MLGKARQGKGRECKEILSAAKEDKAMLGKARHGKAREGNARKF
jgi:hypothetical protein